MRYYSTKNKNRQAVAFAQAALAGLAPDGGLFVPETLPEYPQAVKASLPVMNFHDIAFETIKPFVRGEIPDAILGDIVHDAFNFDAPLVAVGDRYVLELFHGPTAAFKDFGARFMARAFSYFRRNEDKPLRILVATSGDTGGAVADGFFGVDGISVTVLYPKGRVSPLQERQIAGLGKNISAFAVEGSFDDCQRLVKAAFADESLKKHMALSSANSINIARLVPQTVYYANGAARAMAETGKPAVFCVPSGNFGNLTAGMYAREMGAPIRHFIAATNINKTVPDYLENGVYEPRASLPTISNAMDVGAPSNFERMTVHWSLKQLCETLTGVFISDETTRETIKSVHSRYGRFLDPHTAVGWAALDALKSTGKITPEHAPFGTLATAHSAKFAEIVEPLTGAIPIPPSLQKVMNREIRAETIPPAVSALIEHLCPLARNN
ncbi:MAG: threonine synthase [Treponema sp.]|jgi:threonine synthase|nr:threonine synthase [Treponema sp.]